jgi:hypothetical protein
MSKLQLFFIAAKLRIFPLPFSVAAARFAQASENI